MTENPNPRPLLSPSHWPMNGNSVKITFLLSKPTSVYQLALTQGGGAMCSGYDSGENKREQVIKLSMNLCIVSITTYLENYPVLLWALFIWSPQKCWFCAFLLIWRLFNDIAHSFFSRIFKAEYETPAMFLNNISKFMKSFQNPLIFLNQVNLAEVMTVWRRRALDSHEGAHGKIVDLRVPAHGGRPQP